MICMSSYTRYDAIVEAARGDFSCQLRDIKAVLPEDFKYDEINLAKAVHGVLKWATETNSTGAAVPHEDDVTTSIFSQDGGGGGGNDAGSTQVMSAPALGRDAKENQPSCGSSAPTGLKRGREDPSETACSGGAAKVSKTKRTFFAGL